MPSMNVQTYNAITLGILASAVVVAIVLLFIRAPYGRYNQGPLAHGGVPVRWGWMIMELPAPLLIAAGAVLWGVAGSWPNVLLPLMWLSHYLFRTFVYPFRMRARPGDVMPWLPFLMAIVFNVLNGAGNAAAIAGVTGRPAVGDGELARFVAGFMVFYAGMYINRRADRVLMSLRAPRETTYRIPRGWLYERVSCPNYLGESLMWLGFALAANTSAAWAFAAFTAANLWPRALSHHRWYRETFEGYPKKRKAIVPFIL